MTSIPEETAVGDDFLPLVTIVIPVFNGASFLGGAIESALGQTYSSIEVIVVNDGSCDEGATERVARSFGDRIRYFSKENGGVASALNFAIHRMKGEYFSWLSHDDLYLPDKVSQQVGFLTKYEATRTVVYSDYSIFTDEAVADSVSVHMPGVPPKYFRYWLAARSALHGCSLLIPRSMFTEIGTFSERLRTTQDYDLWFSAAEHYSFVHLPAVLIQARNHGSQDTQSRANLAFQESNDLHLSFVKKLLYSEIPGESVDEVGRSYLRLASHLWTRDFIAAGNHSAERARRCGVSSIRVLAVTLHARGTFFLRRVALSFLSLRTKQKVRYLHSLLRGIQRGLKIF